MPGRPMGEVIRAIVASSSAAMAELVAAAVVPSAPLLVPELARAAAQVLAELETGATVRQAAIALGITEKTLENHLQAIYRRLGVSSRTAALHRLTG